MAWLRREQETNIIRGVRPWQAEYTRPYNRGLLIDCEGGDTIIARTDTSAEQEEWSDALATVTELMGVHAGGVRRGGGGGGVYGGGAGDDSDLEGLDGDDDDDDYGGGGIHTTYLAQKDALLSHDEATGPCTVVFQVSPACLVCFHPVGRRGGSGTGLTPGLCWRGVARSARSKAQ